MRRIWAVMGSQVAKTETVINIAGHRLDTDPAPLLYVGPTKSNIESVIEPRIAAMLKECESLRLKTKTGRKARKLAKEVSGVVFRLAWAGSPTELASQPTHTVILDEIDRMKTIKGEGNPVFISEARIATYPDGRLIGCSSPTAGSVETEKDPVSGIEHWKVGKAEDIQSPIWSLWQEGTRFEWAMACIDCGRHFVPRFNLLKWSEKATPREAAKSARLACPHCGSLHEETDKYRMNAGATFLAPGQNVIGYDPSKPGAPTHHQLGCGDGNGEVTGDVEDTDIYSFWVSGLCSPWVSFGQRAAAWVRAVRSGDQERVRAILNTAFGELYALTGDAPKSEDLRVSIAAQYAYGSPPPEAQLIFATVDVQKTRLPYVVRAWGPSFESWLIECGELFGAGDTDVPDVWDKLNKLCDRVYNGMPITGVAVDSGYRTLTVYDWCYRRGASALAVKGVDAPRKIFSSNDIEFELANSSVRNAKIKLWTMADKHFKGWVHARLARPQDAEGAFHIPDGEWAMADEYCRQLVAEQQLRLPSGRTTWIGGHKAHDFLDCEAMQAFLAHVGGVGDLRARNASSPVQQQRSRPQRVIRSPGVSVY